MKRFVQQLEAPRHGRDRSSSDIAIPFAALFSPRSWRRRILAIRLLAASRTLSRRTKSRLGISNTSSAREDARPPDIGASRVPICYLLFAICYSVLDPLRASRKKLRVVNPAIVRGVSTIRVFAVDIDKTALIFKNSLLPNRTDIGDGFLIFG